MKKLTKCLLSCILFISLFGVLNVSANEEGYIFSLKWGGFGSTYSSIYSVAAGKNDCLYVADWENHRIQKFDSSGNFILQWGSYGSGNGQFDFTSAVAVDSNGYVYVLDVNNACVQKFDSNGNFILKWGGALDDAVAITVDSSGYVYTLDVNNCRVQKFDNNGNFLLKWGSYGSGDGQFYVPHGIAADSAGNVYVADTYNHRIQKFDSYGKFLMKWGNEGSGDGQFSEAVNVAVDSMSYVYVADTGNMTRRFQKFDSNGNFLLKFGESYAYNRPTGITVDNNGYIYGTDTVNRYVYKFDNNGIFVSQWGVNNDSADGKFYYPTGMAIDDTSNIYVADTYNHRIQKFDSNGNFIMKWGNEGSGDGQFDYPMGVAVDSAGNIYVADTYNHRIQKFNSSGIFILQWGNSGSGDGQFSYPRGVSVDSAGYIYVADSNNARIQKFDSNGNFITKWGSYGSDDGQFYNLRGIAVDSSSNVYGVDDNGRIQKFDSGGKFLLQWGNEGSGDGQFKWPFGVAVDSTGNVYVTDTANDRIQKFDSKGNFLTKWGSQGSNDGQFSLPQGVTVDSIGNVYVAESGNPRIQKFIHNYYPNVPANPLPEDRAEGQKREITLTWTGGDPDTTDIVSYDIYFGTSPSPSYITTIQNQTSYLVPPLELATTYYWKIIAKDDKGFSIEGPVWSFVSGGGELVIPSNPSPGDNASGQSKNVTLTWTGSNSEIANYDIYFGTAEVPGYVTTQSTNVYTVSGLSPTTTYYWKIIAKDDKGFSVEGPVWRFVTGGGELVIPGNPSPGDNASGQSKNVTLTWVGSNSEIVSYDIYFGTTELPGYMTTQSTNVYTVSGLAPATTYYWKIIAKDEQGFSVEGPVWKFSVGNVSIWGKISGAGDYSQLQVLALPSDLPMDSVDLTPQKIISVGANDLGEYNFLNLVSGSYDLYLVRKNNSKIIKKAPAVNVADGQTAEVNFSVGSTGETDVGAVFGQISNQGGSPDNGLVVLRDSAGEVVGLGINDADGRYRFSTLPDGEYKIFVNCEEYISEKVEGIMLNEGGREREQNLVFRYPALDLNKDNFVSSDDGAVTVEIPAGAFSERTGIIISKKTDVSADSSFLGYPSPLPLPQGERGIYEIKAVSAAYQEESNKINSGRKIKLGLKYRAGIDEKIARNLKVYRLTGNGWEQVAGTQEVNLAEGKVNCWVESLSVFRLAVGASDNLIGLVVYPNPYKPNSGLGHKEITFTGLTGQAKIEIYTLTGQKVREIDKDDSKGDYRWDGRNGEGENLASGIYLYQIEGENGEKKIGKIAIIK